MALITGKDFAFNVDNRTLIRLAIRELREGLREVTLDAIAQVSGLSRAEVKETVRQMLAEGK